MTTLLSLGVTTVITSSIEELEQLLKTIHFEALVWIYGSGHETAIETCLQKARNFSQARPLKLVVLAETIPPNQIERLLRLGVLWIFSHSSRTDAWLPTLENITKVQTHGHDLTQLLKIQPTSVEIRAYCRVGKVDLHSLGHLSIETNVVAKAGEILLLRGGLEKSLNLNKAPFRIKSIHDSNLYYRYSHRLELEPVFTLKPEVWKKWVAENSNEWVIPKSKLLWVTANFSLTRESLFDKKLFSVYTETPNRLNGTVLNRVAPRIIIVETLEGDMEQTLTTWARTQPAESVLLVKLGDAAPLGWEACHCFSDDSLSKEFTDLLRSFLKRRIIAASQDAKFLSRNSELSRAFFSMEATLSELSTRNFSFISDLDFVPMTVLGIDLTQHALSSHILYGHVVTSEFLADHRKYRVYCEWVPCGEPLETILPGFRKLLV